jgi:hypothetical protein
MWASMPAQRAMCSRLKAAVQRGVQRVRVLHRLHPAAGRRAQRFGQRQQRGGARVALRKVVVVEAGQGLAAGAVRGGHGGRAATFATRQHLVEQRLHRLELTAAQAHEAVGQRGHQARGQAALQRGQHAARQAHQVHHDVGT